MRATWPVREVRAHADDDLARLQGHDQGVFEGLLNICALATEGK
jgi:hypothetical protein